MAKLPPKKEEGNSQEWLNTYADMVTLLLTFFVLLFACSNLDETKLQYVFQEFKARGHYVNQVLTNRDPYADGDGGVTNNGAQPGGEGNMPQSFEELYTYLADYVESNNLSDSVAVEQGAAHIKIRFDNAIMFDGDSYFLKSEGRALLDAWTPAFRAIDFAISRNTISGHTSVGTSIMNDWSLSSMRASSVATYLQTNKIMEPKKMRVMGCGPYEPDPDADVPAKNRRVEMLLLKNELDITDMNVIKDILKHDYNIGSAMFDPENQKPVDISKLPPGSVDKIVATIKDKFKDDSLVNPGKYGPTDIDGNKFIATETSGGKDTSS
ncbi:MAG: OmpA family protein [Oscillospiraceae bacterium]|nr:OmpA family protein [Oscillospiraceae bacterium]